MMQAIILRDFQAPDGTALVGILRRNRQYQFPRVEGIAAMQRVAACKASIFIVAEVEKRPWGFIKGGYDGSRALIHLLSVHPKMQHCGLGSRLVKAFRAECAKRGALSLSVTATEQSRDFWKKQGFTLLPVSLMLQESI